MIKSTKELQAKTDEYILMQQIEIQLALLSELKKVTSLLKQKNKSKT